MFRLARSISNLAKPFLNPCRNFQVSVVGASRPLGQSISMLMKEHPLIHRLTMYDRAEKTSGVAMDVSHIPREAQVEGWAGRMEMALRCSDIVVVACGKAKKSGQTDQELFKQNADSVIETMQQVVTHCPNAFVVIATDPINQTVPLASKVLEHGGCYDKSKVLGVSELYTMKAQSCVGGVYQINPLLVRVPVICGNSSKTAVPLFSHVIPRFEINKFTACVMTEKIRKLDDEVANFKKGNGESTLSSAYATFSTVSSILNAMNGYAVQQVAFVANNDYGTKYFAAPVILTCHGIAAVMQYKLITDVEANYIHQSTAQLSKDVHEGESYFDACNHLQSKAKTNNYHCEV